MSAFLLTGCAVVQQGTVPEILPFLVDQEPLPSLSPMIHRAELKLDAKLLIGIDGSVVRVELLTPTDDPTWNAEAEKRIMKWKFSPARWRGRVVPVWIQQSLRIHFMDLLLMALAEIVCTESSQADSVYALLNAGTSVEAIGQLTSAKIRSMGMKDVRRYPVFVQKQLVPLRVNEVTRPVRIGEQYVVFKRLQEPIK